MNATGIRTYHARAGRMGPRHRSALSSLWPSLGVEVDGEPLDPAVLFGRAAPLVVEIGSGMGDATVEMAAADPGRDYLAVDVHTPGIANLLAAVDDRGLTNVRVARGDALVLVGRMLREASLSAVHVFFPDPWPKVRHHKRRLIQPAHLPVLRSRLAPGGRAALRDRLGAVRGVDAHDAHRRPGPGQPARRVRAAAGVPPGDPLRAPRAARRPAGLRSGVPPRLRVGDRSLID